MGTVKTLFTEWQIWVERQIWFGDSCSCGPKPAEECPTHGYEAWRRKTDAN